MALAFVVRAYWTLRIQSPVTAVYSDMGGYVSRAEWLIAGFTPAEPRILAMWPWGTHAIVAVELAAFGREGWLPIGLVHAFVGAIAAPCAALLTARFVRSRLAVLAAGLLVALWHPHIVYSGFFSSEIWFSSALALISLLFVRHFEGRSGALGAGIFLAIAFCCRPQILVTFGLVGGTLAIARLRRASFRRGTLLRTAVPLVLPLVLAMGVSSVRFHHLTGRYGLIAAYEPAQRLFGETSVGKIDASWQAPDGNTWSWWFSPSTKQPVKPEDVVVMNGFICDPDLLAQIRADRLRDVPFSARVGRMADNVALLAVHNMPWPEDDMRRFVFRDRLQHAFANALLPLLGFCALGMFFLRRHAVAALLIVANLLTIVFVAAIYLGEARYRIPYDPFIIVVATVGAHGLLVRGRRLLSARRPSRAPHTLSRP